MFDGKVLGEVRELTQISFGLRYLFHFVGALAACKPAQKLDKPGTPCGFASLACSNVIRMIWFAPRRSIGISNCKRGASEAQRKTRTNMASVTYGSLHFGVDVWLHLPPILMFTTHSHISVPSRRKASRHTAQTPPWSGGWVDARLEWCEASG